MKVMNKSSLAVLVLVSTCAGAAGPLPPATAGERAAAFPDLVTAEAHGHTAEPVYRSFEAQELEWQGRDGRDALGWDVTAWVGTDRNRLWLRDEGERVRGDQVRNRLELAWWRPLAPWWDLLAGVRHDTGPGPSRTYAAVGVQGIAPQWLEVEATAYLGERGQAGVRLEADYDWLLTNRLILGGRAEGEAWSEDDAANGIGSGIAKAGLGLRLRYEIRRELAPYVGVEWVGRFGDTADLVRDAGEEVRDTRLVAGVRFWF